MSEIKTLDLQQNRGLEMIVKYTAGVCVDNWIRVLGQSCTDHYGILVYNSKQAETEFTAMKGMLIVAQDVVGARKYECFLRRYEVENMGGRL